MESQAAFRAAVLILKSLGIVVRYGTRTIF